MFQERGTQKRNEVFKMKFVKVMFPVMLVLFVVIILFCACKDAANTPINSKIEIKQYPTCGTVTEINRENGKVVVKDFNGNLWAFEGSEDWIEGDICAMIMSDEGTPEIYDDVIVQVRYCGWNY